MSARKGNIEEKIVHMAQHHGMPPDKLRAELESSGRLTELRQSLKHDKVREFLRSKAKFVTAETAGNEATEASDSGGGSAGSSADSSAGSSAGSSETVDET